MFFYLTLITLSIIFFQDVKSRAIWWFLPPILFVFILFDKSEEIEFIQIVMNIVFIVGILLALLIYLRFRFGKEGKSFFKYFGMGDLLYLLAITPILKLSGFIYFFTISTIFTLVIHYLINLMRLQKNIPYAGYLSLCTMTFLILKETNILISI